MIKIKRILCKRNFYYEVLENLIISKYLSVEESVLIVGGTRNDKETFLALGFKEVTISNLDKRMNKENIAPYKHSYQNAEHLTFDDNSFDHVITSHCLHHCRSPHRALTEMMRVSRKSAIAFEGRDSSISRIGQKLGTSEIFELNAVKFSKFVDGGLNNTIIPNHVYRWNEKELVKVARSYLPEVKENLMFFYSLDLKFYVNKLKEYKNKTFYLIALAAKPFLYLLFLLFPAQSNKYAFLIDTEIRNERLQRWLKKNGDEIQIVKENFYR